MPKKITHTQEDRVEIQFTEREFMLALWSDIFFTGLLPHDHLIESEWYVEELEINEIDGETRGTVTITFSRISDMPQSRGFADVSGLTTD